MKELYVIPFSTIFKVIDFSHLPNLALLGNSFIVQLLSIIHEIQTTFDENLTIDVRGVLKIDISKAFDKVWHGEIIFKLKGYGVEGELLSLPKNDNTHEIF